MENEDYRLPPLGEELEEEELGSLRPDEIWWRDHSSWLGDKGYTLRQRYNPGWIPSWLGTGRPNILFEDGLSILHLGIMDAIRVSDGRYVCLKQIIPSKSLNEMEIVSFLAQIKDKRNPCVPVYETLLPPDDTSRPILVMPLGRNPFDPVFRTVGEVMHFLRQVFEGLQFLHELDIAHADCCDQNIIMDVTDMYPEGFHPLEPELSRDFQRPARHYSRTERPPRYYFIDFGFATKFGPSQARLMPHVRGGDKTVPEHLRDPLRQGFFNPFLIDVYTVGNMIRQRFLDGDPVDRRMRPGMRRLEFLSDLASDMVNDDPNKRPSMNEVVSRFTEIERNLSWFKLRSRPISRTETSAKTTFFEDVKHFFWTVGLILRGIPALPSIR
ncbi:hypothetical protein VKT23_019691 [Stygiomarasmius scandens]|uniref:Protein kinase domain-containing protein n=1 Tax=Marasmiellus scandens TaxID=2682957 RepID=A0ABR1IP41_9AGAR